MYDFFKLTSLSDDFEAIGLSESRMKKLTHGDEGKPYTEKGYTHNYRQDKQETQVFDYYHDDGVSVDPYDSDEIKPYQTSDFKARKAKLRKLAHKHGRTEGNRKRQTSNESNLLGCRRFQVAGSAKTKQMMESLDVIKGLVFEDKESLIILTLEKMDRVANLLEQKVRRMAGGVAHDTPAGYDVGQGKPHDMQAQVLDISKEEQNGIDDYLDDVGQVKNDIHHILKKLKRHTISQSDVEDLVRDVVEKLGGMVKEFSMVHGPNMGYDSGFAAEPNGAQVNLDDNDYDDGPEVDATDNVIQIRERQRRRMESDEYDDDDVYDEDDELDSYDDDEKIMSSHDDEYDDDYENELDDDEIDEYDDDDEMDEYDDEMDDEYDEDDEDDDDDEMDDEYDDDDQMIDSDDDFEMDDDEYESDEYDDESDEYDEYDESDDYNFSKKDADYLGKKDKHYENDDYLDTDEYDDDDDDDDEYDDDDNTLAEK